ncbi:MAG TPA: hypothetical protein VHA77_14070 [Xanthobacteraceae bacterium]|nr:hypothetical protein [Xanthobacteraceae bacterium]
MLPLAIISLGSQLVLAQVTLVADKVPKFNVEPSCRSVASGDSGTRRDVQSCLNDENSARDDLVKQWNQFSAADRQRCTDLATMGGEPSYVELFECLDMTREAAGERSSTTGQNRSGAGRTGPAIRPASPTPGGTPGTSTPTPGAAPKTSPGSSPGSGQ